mmetsp:Transcript_1762/g.6307  ORF Transcript_1762/g.6307 Transcript_1762/m.6307 type:complete len:535 (-) Transcript_1762:284-1888(-)
MSVISRVRIRLRCFCTWLSSWSSFIKNFKNLNCTFTNRKELSTNTSTTKTFSSSSFEFEEDKEEEGEERRSEFGKGTRERMQFADFMTAFERGDHSKYLSASNGERCDKRDGRPEILSVPLKSLVNPFMLFGNELRRKQWSNEKRERDLTALDGEGKVPLRPKLMGWSAVSTVNMWMGRGTRGETSSGLHHDFHDNLYVLARGFKRFELYAPSECEKMYLKGRATRVCENGMICYDDETPSYGKDFDAAKERVEREQKRLEKQWAIERGEVKKEKEKKEEEEEEDDESFYVGDVECIADVSFVSDADGNPGDVKLMAEKARMDEGKLEKMRERFEKDARAILKLFVDASGGEIDSSGNFDVYDRLRENLGDDFPEQLSHAELSVALCDDAYIQALNKEWRSKDAPTDVLSFPSGGVEEGIAAFGPICVLGDIIISVETARAQAEEVGHSLEDELRVLLAHGFAHLLGFDHELGEEEEKDMQELEREIMVALGWDYIKDGGLIDRVSSSSSASSSPSFLLLETSSASACSAEPMP